MPKSLFEMFHKLARRISYKNISFSFAPGVEGTREMDYQVAAITHLSSERLSGHYIGGDGRTISFSPSFFKKPAKFELRIKRSLSEPRVQVLVYCTSRDA